MMEVAEYYAVQTDLLAHISDVFEISLGFTFAALVAFHFVANQLSERIVRFAKTLYVLASIMFVARYLAFGVAAARVGEELLHLGMELLVPRSLGSFILVLMILLYVAGTVVTVVYANSRFQQGNAQ